MRKYLIVLLSLLVVSQAVFAAKQGIVKNGLFSITIPEQFKGHYITTIKKDKILIKVLSNFFLSNKKNS